MLVTTCCPHTTDLFPIGYIFLKSNSNASTHTFPYSPKKISSMAILQNNPSDEK